MKKLIIILFFIYSITSFGFTLVSNPPTKFPINEITVNMTNNACDQSGYTATEILDMVELAIDRFWNAAPTSGLELKRGGITTDTNVAHTIETVRALAEVNTILVACSNHATTFDEWIGGVGGITSNGVDVKGGLILNNEIAGKLSGMTEDTRLALIAHEIGHALGLHHSNDKIALMYYTLNGKTQKKLSRDDRDGITYLYPQKSITGGCGTIEMIGAGGGGFPTNMIFSFIFGLLSISLIFIPVRSYVFVKNKAC